jgi:O-antigen/teichoic acid export membrane protein
LLIPRYGLIGAAITSAVSVAAQNLIFLYKANEFVDIRFNWLYYGKFILSGLPAAYLGEQLLSVGLNSYVEIGLAGLVYSGSYFIFLVLLKTFTEEDEIILRAVEEKIGMRIPYAHLLFRD